VRRGLWAELESAPEGCDGALVYRFAFSEHARAGERRQSRQSGTWRAPRSACKRRPSAAVPIGGRWLRATEQRLASSLARRTNRVDRVQRSDRSEIAPRRCSSRRAANAARERRPSAGDRSVSDRATSRVEPRTQEESVGRAPAFRSASDRSPIVMEPAHREALRARDRSARPSDGVSAARGRRDRLRWRGAAALGLSAARGCASA